MHTGAETHRPHTHSHHYPLVTTQMTQQRAKEIEALKERNRKAEEAKARKEAAQKRAIEEQAERNAAMRRERAQRKKEKEEALLREKRYQAWCSKFCNMSSLLSVLTSAAMPHRRAARALHAESRNRKQKVQSHRQKLQKSNAHLKQTVKVSATRAMKANKKAVHGQVTSQAPLHGPHRDSKSAPSACATTARTAQ